MSEFICFLVLVYSPGPKTGMSQLLRTALKVHRDDISEAVAEWPNEPDSRAILQEFLPQHARGEIAEVERIFEVHVAERKKP